MAIGATIVAFNSYSTAALARETKQDARASTLVKASNSVRQALLTDAGARQPARCFSVLLSRSSARWASVTFSAYAMKKEHRTECMLADGMSIYAKGPDSWGFVVGGTSMECANFKAALRKAGAPRPVVADFAAVYFCGRS